VDAKCRQCANGEDEKKGPEENHGRKVTRGEKGQLGTVTWVPGKGETTTNKKAGRNGRKKGPQPTRGENGVFPFSTACLKVE